MGAAALIAAAPASGQACDPGSACCVVTCDGTEQLPRNEECAADTCACAQTLHCVIENGLSSWDLYPDSVAFEPTTRPVHGRYMTIQVNPLADAGLTSFAPGTPGPVEMPDGAIIVKSNFVPDPSQVGVPDTDPNNGAITSMIKLRGYCPETSGAWGDCVGGEWFYLLRVDDTFPTFGSPGGCTNCHSSAQQGDWLWRLFAARRFSAPLSTTTGGSR